MIQESYQQYVIGNQYGYGFRASTIYGNFFLNGAGIRVKEGQNQMIYNNYFQTGERFSIMLVNYKVDPLENIVIAHNTFAASGGIQFGGKGEFILCGAAITTDMNRRGAEPNGL